MSQTRRKLERRARALLRAYPAEYRDGRAEEMIGTLLEAAPPGRSFPTAREAWSLIAGGRHARAAQNRRLGVKANARLAVLLGISTYLSFQFSPLLAASLGFYGGNIGTSWVTDTMGALGFAVALVPWLGSRAATIALAIPAGAFIAYGELSAAHGSATVMSLPEFLIVLAAFAALSGGPTRLPRSWLWLPCALPLVMVAGRLLSFAFVLSPTLDIASSQKQYLDTLVPLAVLVACWLVTDARPAFALCLSVLLADVVNYLPGVVVWGGGWPMVAAELRALLPQLAVVLPVLLPAAWLLLRRQKATPSSRPFSGR